MPLSAPEAAREAVHYRSVETCGFQREDGLWDIEGRLRDTKTYAFNNRWRGQVEAGDAVHDMWLRLTIDNELLVVAVDAATDYAPFSICDQVVENYKRMVGVRIGSGWRREISQRLGRAAGCTHLRELLGLLGATAYQTVLPKLFQARLEGYGDDSETRPDLLNTCYAWHESSEMIRESHPNHYVAVEK